MFSRCKIPRLLVLLQTPLNSLSKMKQLYLAILLCLPMSPLAQNTLFFETFEGVATLANLNTADLGGSTTGGNNFWVINDVYQGGSGTLTCLGFPFSFTVPNNPTQPSGIFQEGGNYMHILAQAAQDNGIGNANYLPADGVCTFAESNFAEMSDDVNTQQMQNVSLSFWWMCGGSTTSFGELYVSTDGGNSWQQVNTPSFANQTTWTQSSFTDPTWTNQSQLRFGFRFVNNLSTTGMDPGFAIDDILITAEPAVSLTLDSLSQTQLCASEDSFEVFYSTTGLFDTPNHFVVELSDSTGDFTQSMPLDSVNATSVQPLNVHLPSGLASGGAYQVRMRATHPALISDSSVALGLTPPNLAQALTADPASICERDSTTIMAGSFQGNLQWQTSVDSVNFTNVAGFAGHPLNWQPDSNGFVRLIASGGVCPADTSNTVMVSIESVTAGFTLQLLGGLEVACFEQSPGAATWQWSFGDGDSATGPNPIHEYPADGTYEICQVAISKIGCRDTICQSVTLERTGIGSAPAFESRVYPNPTQDILHVEWSGTSAVLTIFDLNGKVVQQTAADSVPYTLDLGTLPPGNYWLQIQDDNRSVRHIVQRK